jgi:SAM-dependent methyltransferase
MPGARQTPGFAIGRSLMPSPEEWAARNQALSSSLVELINSYAPRATGRALDVGCQWGVMLDKLASDTRQQWWGVDPVIERHLSRAGHQLDKGMAHDLPYPDRAFDCVVLANVYEHIAPEQRAASMSELCRVLVPTGVVIGQLPNPYFPIESHSRLPLMGYLPPRLQNLYWNVSPSRRGAGFYSVTVGNVKKTAVAAGLTVELIRRYNYPLEAAPTSVRRILHAVRGALDIVPWAWQFVLRRP